MGPPKSKMKFSLKLLSILVITNKHAFEIFSAKMSDIIRKSPLIQQDLMQHLQQTVNRNGKEGTGLLTRKRSRELMQEGTDLLQLSSPVPQKKGLLSFKVSTLSDCKYSKV